MTDRDKLTELLSEWGVQFTLDDNQDIVVETGNDGKVTGYTGFYTVFEFTPDGTFTRMGAWE